jgi:hypothetical protein
VPLVLLFGVLLGVLLSLLSPEAEESRFEHMRFFFGFTPNPILRFHVFLTTIEMVLLIALFAVYVKVYSDTHANFSLGIVIVLGALFVNTLLTYPLLQGLAGPVPVGPGGFVPVADIFMIVAYVVFLYLSLE